jgi:hypothetical protein
MAARNLVKSRKREKPSSSRWDINDQCVRGARPWMRSVFFWCCSDGTRVLPQKIENRIARSFRRLSSRQQLDLDVGISQMAPELAGALLSRRLRLDPIKSEAVGRSRLAHQSGRTFVRAAPRIRCSSSPTPYEYVIKMKYRGNAETGTRLGRQRRLRLC